MFEVIVGVPNPERYSSDTSEYRFKLEVLKQMIVRDSKFTLVPNGLLHRVGYWESHLVMAPTFVDAMELKQRIINMAPDWLCQVRETTTPPPVASE